MTTAALHATFPHNWSVEILAQRPLILPPRSFVFPQQVEEVERGALELLIRPSGAAQPFLATCALGFRDPLVPTGVWSCPNPDEICAVSGGYAYLIDTTAPDRFTMLSYRPVLQVIFAAAPTLLLFVSHRNILGWGRNGQQWESPKLSDEGILITSVSDATLHGLGWNMMTDKETPFALDLETGRLTPAPSSSSSEGA